MSGPSFQSFPMPGAAWVLLCLMGFVACGKSIVFQHRDQTLPIHYDRAAVEGRAYTSLGNIVVVKRKFGAGVFLWPFFPFGLTWGHASRYRDGLEAGAGKQSFADETMTLLNQQLLARAREMGATAVINVKYTQTEYPVLLPIFGPLTRSSFAASGEAVRLDPVDARRTAPARPGAAPGAPARVAPALPDPRPPAVDNATPAPPAVIQESPPQQDPGLFFDPGEGEPEPPPGKPPAIFDPEQQFDDPGEDAYPGFDPGA